jgi:hypothetical protein
MATRITVFVAGCALLAGCGVVTAATTAVVREVPASSYRVCPSLASNCTSANVLREPPQMNLFTAKSGFVQGVFLFGIIWRGWGEATATGIGIAQTDNCEPNCEDGTFSNHPATIVATAPMPWHGKMAYTRVTASVPAIGFYEVYDRGLLPDVAPVQRPRQASVIGSCQMGFEMAAGDGAWSGFLLGIPPLPPADAQTIAYRLLLVNMGASTATVTGFVVAFYGVSGSKLATDYEPAGETSLAAGQSRSWLEVAMTNTAGKRVRGTVGHPDARIPSRGTARTCTLIRWQHP